MTVKILSWNIWIDSHFNLVKEFLQDSGADIIGLQEVRSDDPERPTVQFLESLGYSSVFAPVAKIWGGKTWNDGPALFTKLPIVETKTYMLGVDDRRAVARADIKIGDVPLHVFSTHLTHTHQQESEVQTQQVEELLSLLPKENSVLMGDFNATPTSSTIHKVRELFTDTDPNDLATWSVYPQGCSICKPQQVETKLDYIFTTNDIITHSYNVEHSKGSDHLPISIVIEL